MQKVGITVKLLSKEKNEFKQACIENDTDMSKYLAQQAKLFTAKCKRERKS